MTANQSTRYDACLWWTLDNPCNLDCVYCCATRVNPGNAPLKVDLLTATLAATGRTFRLHFSSIGEPFLTPRFVDALEELTEYHFISFNTNLVARSVPDFARRIAPERVVDMTASLHIHELRRRGFTDRFVENFRDLAERGFPVKAQVVAHPTILGELDYYREYFRNRGVPFHCNHFIGEHDGKQYPGAYTDAELDAFGRNIAVGAQWRHQAGNPCNAGYNIAVVLPNGTVTHCYDVKRVLGHVYERIAFDPHVSCCPSEWCSCALNHMDESLYLAALDAGPVGITGS